MPYFRAHDGESAVARKWDGTLLQDVWPWRKNYFACVGTEKGRQMVLEMTRRMAEFGPDVVQKFDQGPGPFACYAANHGHPPVPGPWMTEGFNGLVRSDAATAKSVNPNVAMSCEGAPPETYLQDFQTWDGRTTTCPLYSFLYHEYANGFGGCFTNRVNDEALPGPTLPLKLPSGSAPICPPARQRWLHGLIGHRFVTYSIFDE